MERIPAVVMQISIRTRVVMVVVALGLAAAGVVTRLVILQVVESDRLRARARRQHEQVIEVGGRRGSIVDRDGREFAVSISTQSLYAHPPRVKDPDRMAHLLAPYLSRTESELRTLLRSGESFVWLQRRIDPVASRAIAQLDPQIGKGGPIFFEEEPKRYYPQGALAVHVVGFADLDQHGIEGIEKRFDDVLQGDSSKFLEVRDARGATDLQLLRPPAKRSHDVVLTIDLVLQHIVERELDAAMDETGAKAATAIVLDPKTGQVLALANRPTVDPLGYGKAPAEARRNRAIESVYEPGSTFKVVSASAALEQGTVTPEQRFNCTSYTIAGKTYSDVHKFGELSVREILEHSSNVGMVQVGRTVPRETLRDTIVRFGFGRKSGIELPGERNGNITSLARMSATSPAAMSIGYEVDVTPLQVAQAYGVIANDGILVPARIVLGTRDDNGNVVGEDPPESRRVVSARTAVTMTNMMEGVVLRGTGTSAQIPGYHVAGKTGTAKKIVLGEGRYTDHEYYASFGGFGPLRDPRLVAFVVLDTPRGGYYFGGQAAAPVFARIVSDAFAYLRIPPDDSPWDARQKALKAQADKQARPTAKRQAASGPQAADSGTAAPTLLVTTPGQVPDLRGKSGREAVAALVARGYRARLDGQGVVVRQTPTAGTAVAPGQPCTLHLGDPTQLHEDAARPQPDDDARRTGLLVTEARPVSAPRRDAKRKR